MAWIRRLQPLWALSPRAFAHHPTHLEPMASPQPAHSLLVDPLSPIDQNTDPTIPIARVVGGQMLNLGQQWRVVGRVRTIVERRPMDLHQGTGTAHRQPTRDQVLNGGALIDQRQPFFSSSSLSRSFSSIRSARRRLSRPFSFSSSFKRWTSFTDMPP
jgi:hypothetical protein